MLARNHLLQLLSDSSYQHSQGIVEVIRVAARSHNQKAASAYNESGNRTSGPSFHEGLTMTGNELLIKGRIYNNMAGTLLLVER